MAADSSLAYASLRRLQNLWRVALDPRTLELSGEPERLMSASWNDFALLVTADGSWLLFTSLKSGNRDVWAVRSDGSELRQLTHEPTQDAHGLWSPDGSRVLYLSDHRALHVTGFDEDGTDRVLLDLGETIDYTHLAADGSMLLFTRERVEGDIWLIE